MTQRGKAMTRLTFIARMRRLGYDNPNAASVALGIDRTGVWRIWMGLRGVTPSVARLVKMLEATQPARITPLAARVLRTAPRAEAGAPVWQPKNRNKYDVNRFDWKRTLREMTRDGLIVQWESGYLLTELGARCRQWVDDVLPKPRRPEKPYIPGKQPKPKRRTP